MLKKEISRGDEEHLRRRGERLPPISSSGGRRRPVSDTQRHKVAHYWLRPFEIKNLIANVCATVMQEFHIRFLFARFLFCCRLESSQRSDRNTERSQNGWTNSWRVLAWETIHEIQENFLNQEEVFSDCEHHGTHLWRCMRVKLLFLVCVQVDTSPSLSQSTHT